MWSIEAHTRSLEHLEGSAKGFDQCYRMAWFDMLRNLEGFWVSQEWMAMADKWAMDQKRSWV
jgi:hypothetical protein